MICGIDEAGRGPLAGPVCAAAVVLPPEFPVSMLNDSKKLSPAKREAARRLIVECAVAWGIGWASHEEIDAINILQASLLAMRRAFEAMLLARKGPSPLITTADIEEASSTGTVRRTLAFPVALWLRRTALCRKSWPPQFWQKPRGIRKCSAMPRSTRNTATKNTRAIPQRNTTPR